MKKQIHDLMIRCIAKMIVQIRKVYKMDKKRLAAYIICLLTACFAAVRLISYGLQTHRAQQRYEAALEAALAADDETQQTSQEETTVEEETSQTIASTQAEEETAYAIPERNLDFNVLWEENEDIYAWITIPDTNIDYPILQHPTEPDYYLDYNIDGTKGYPGCIYSQYLNSKDFSDFNTVLYGHNMRIGTMFANLHKYEDEEFFETHPYVYIYTPQNVLVYQIFASCVFPDTHLLYGYDLDTVSGRKSYLADLYACDGAKDHFNPAVEVDADSHILTLSTCIGSDAAHRYLVSAVLVMEKAL